MPTPHKKPKSPLVLLTMLAILTVATLVVASSYFLRPSIELELKNKLVQSFATVGLWNTQIKISGRDVILNGFVNNADDANKAENIAKKTSGIRDVSNHLLIKKQTIE